MFVFLYMLVKYLYVLWTLAVLTVVILTGPKDKGRGVIIRIRCVV